MLLQKDRSMSDEQANEVIRLRHQLRAIAALRRRGGRDDADRILERFREVCERMGEEELLFEHARWRVQLDQLGAG